MLTFDEASHRYFWNQTPMISVTQALGMAGLIDSTWYTEFSRQRGKAVHLATQFDDEGGLDETTVSPIVRPYLEAARKFKADAGFVPELIEHRVYNLECGYAGTLDRTGSIEKKQRATVDYKSGAIQDWARLQLAGYNHALPDGASRTRYTVQLKPDATYKIERYDVKDFRRDVSDFLACVRVAQLIEKRNDRKELAA